MLRASYLKEMFIDLGPDCNKTPHCSWNYDVVWWVLPWSWRRIFQYLETPTTTERSFDTLHNEA